MVRTQIDLHRLFQQVGELGQLTEEYQAAHQKITHVNVIERIFGKRKKKILQLFDEINVKIQHFQTQNNEVQSVQLGEAFYPYQKWLDDAKAYFKAVEKHVAINLELQALYKLSFLEKFEKTAEIDVKLQQLEVATENCIATGTKYNDTVQKVFNT